MTRGVGAVEVKETSACPPALLLQVREGELGEVIGTDHRIEVAGGHGIGHLRPRVQPARRARARLGDRAHRAVERVLPRVDEARQHPPDVVGPIVEVHQQRLGSAEVGEDVGRPGEVRQAHQVVTRGVGGDGLYEPHVQGEPLPVGVDLEPAVVRVVDGVLPARVLPHREMELRTEEGGCEDRPEVDPDARHRLIDEVALVQTQAARLEPRLRVLDDVERLVIAGAVARGDADEKRPVGVEAPPALPAIGDLGEARLAREPSFDDRVKRGL